MGHQENSGLQVDDSIKYTDKNLNANTEKGKVDEKNSNDHIEKDAYKKLDGNSEKEKSKENNSNYNTDKTKGKNSDKKQDDISEKKKRKHKKYKTSINHSALKELEGTTANSFLDLANAVILIDNASYDETYLPMSKARKNDFKRLIEHYAVIVVIGKRKYYIKQVYSRKQKEELNDIEINSNRDNSKK